MPKWQNFAKSGHTFCPTGSNRATCTACPWRRISSFLSRTFICCKWSHFAFSIIWVFKRKRTYPEWDDPKRQKWLFSFLWWLLRHFLSSFWPSSKPWSRRWRRYRRRTWPCGAGTRTGYHWTCTGAESGWSCVARFERRLFRWSSEPNESVRSWSPCCVCSGRGRRWEGSRSFRPKSCHFRFPFPARLRCLLEVRRTTKNWRNCPTWSRSDRVRCCDDSDASSSSVTRLWGATRRRRGKCRGQGWEGETPWSKTWTLSSEMSRSDSSFARPSSRSCYCCCCCCLWCCCCASPVVPPCWGRLGCLVVHSTLLSLLLHRGNLKLI